MNDLTKQVRSEGVPPPSPPQLQRGLEDTSCLGGNPSPRGPRQNLSLKDKLRKKGYHSFTPPYTVVLSISDTLGTGPKLFISHCLILSDEYLLQRYLKMSVLLHFSGTPTDKRNLSGRQNPTRGGQRHT